VNVPLASLFDVATLQAIRTALSAELVPLIEAVPRLVHPAANVGAVALALRPA